MNFQTMQNNLRRILLERIESRELTGLRLSQQTGFRQAHVSNFLNCKRGLSLEGMDKVLRVQKLSIFDLLDPKEISRHVSVAPQHSDEFQNVPLVAASDAHVQRIGSNRVEEVLPFRKSFLSKLRPAIVGNRNLWERFLLIRVERDMAESMFPKLELRAIVLIDRHYTSLRPYRKGDLNLYAVRYGGQCAVRYVEQMGYQLLLRPVNASWPIEIVALNGGKMKYCVIGRICYVGSEV